MNFNSFRDLYKSLEFKMKYDSQEIHTHNWQGGEIKNLPEGRMVELLHLHAVVNLGDCRDIEGLKENVNPNLPWAEDHFLERVCGYPINPGIEWANWPWGNSAQHYLEVGQFNHNYMERYWPKYAGRCGVPSKTPQEFRENVAPLESQNFGIRNFYGDLDDLTSLLYSEPDTRQAYFPVWFPEDTGKIDTRKPCSIGYHFIIRNNKMDINYFLRSCDYYRHFKDDIYLTIRLAQWILERIDKPEVKLGKLILNITSLHMFINDYIKMYGSSPRG